MTKWKTAISKTASDSIRMRGYDISDIMEKLSYAEAVYLLLKGDLPDKAEAEIMNAILVSSIDHGPTPPSVLASRTVVSGGNPINAAMAAGLLVIGDAHGGAVEESARIMQEWGEKIDDEMSNIDSVTNELIVSLTQSKTRMPGFGHLLHKTDPRTIKLFEIADRNGRSGKHVALCRTLEEKLSKKIGKKLPINIDGSIAAVMSDLGFDWRLGKGLFAISRLPGLLAHSYEELMRERPLRVLGPPEYDYDGPDDREIE